ncbi:MAG: DMT family transporter [Eubacteriales bacterium]|nr:DMT family transporter [Eubacteriales bacterium]
MECGKKELGELNGHLIALATICVWGSTFIFSKTLLDVFTPVQIMLLRFFVAYAVLWCMYPKTEKTTARDNLGIFFMSLFADTVYFLCENNALRYTLASNVSILVASAPIWTAVLAHFFIKGNKLRKNTVYGSLIALVGVALVVFNGTVVLKFNPFGDMLSMAAAICWALYSVMITHYVHRFSSFFLMRRMTFFAILTTLPLAFFMGELNMPLYEFADPHKLFCIVFLGILGSGISYVTWNIATRRLGIVKVNTYIYVNPFVTLVTGALFLHEPITLMSVIGALLIICGVIIGVRERKGACPEQ